MLYYKEADRSLRRLLLAVFSAMICFICLTEQVYHKVEALRLNAHQMNSYITHYARISSDLPRQKVSRLQAQLDHTEKSLQGLITDMFTHNKVNTAHETLHRLEREYKLYMDDVKNMCKDIWAKFDFVSMALGFFLFAMSILVNVYVFYMIGTLGEDKWLGSGIIVFGLSLVYSLICVLNSFFMEIKSLSFMAIIFGAVIVVALIIIIQLTRSNSEESQNRKTISEFKTSLLSKSLPYLVIAISCMCYFSNSFVVFEDSIIVFCSQTLVMYFCARVIYTAIKENTSVRDLTKSKLKNAKTPETRKMPVQTFVPFVLLALLCCLFIRLSANYRTQREEQQSEEVPVEDESTYKTITSNRNVQFFISAACVVLSVYCPRKWLASSGNLNGVTGTVLCMRYLIPAGAVTSVLYWALQVGITLLWYTHIQMKLKTVVHKL